jgi:hypothetical protein
MLHDELTEGLTNTMSPPFFGNFVKVIIGKVEFVTSLDGISSETLSWPNGLSWYFCT